MRFAQVHQKVYRARNLEGLLENLENAKEAEKLGSDCDENEYMKSLKDSVTQLLAELDLQTKQIWEQNQKNALVAAAPSTICDSAPV